MSFIVRCGSQWLVFPPTLIPVLTSVFIDDFACPEFHINGIVKKNLLFVQIHLTIIFWNLPILLYVSSVSSLLFLSTIPLYECTTVCLLILTWGDFIVCFWFGTHVAVSILKWLGTQSLISVGCILELGRLGHRVGTDLTLLDTMPQFPKVGGRFYGPANNRWEFRLFHIVLYTWCWRFY